MWKLKKQLIKPTFRCLPPQRTLFDGLDPFHFFFPWGVEIYSRRNTHPGMIYCFLPAKRLNRLADVCSWKRNLHLLEQVEIGKIGGMKNTIANAVTMVVEGG
jgi:hypothetical protein